MDCFLCYRSPESSLSIPIEHMVIAELQNYTFNYESVFINKSINSLFKRFLEKRHTIECILFVEDVNKVVATRDKYSIMQIQKKFAKYFRKASDFEINVNQKCKNQLMDTFLEEDKGKCLSILSSMALEVKHLLGANENIFGFISDQEFAIKLILFKGDKNIFTRRDDAPASNRSTDELLVPSSARTVSPVGSGN